MDDDILYLIGGALLLKAIAGYQDKIVPAIEQKGADAYEVLHPSEVQHANDLPGKGLTRKQVRWYVDHMAFAQPDVAVAICMAESGGVPNALTHEPNGALSVGLWQINTRAWPQWTREELADPKRNAEAAFAISKGGTDWRAWSTWWKDPRNKAGPGQGRFLNFMPKGG